MIESYVTYTTEFPPPPLDGPDDPRAATSLPAITPRRKIMES
jgi:hypothetical protein